MTENHKLENNFFYISPFKDGEGGGGNLRHQNSLRTPRTCNNVLCHSYLCTELLICIWTI